MNDYLKATGFVLVGVILCLVLSGQSKHFTVLVTITVCAVIAIAALHYLQPVLNFFDQLQSLGNWDKEMTTTLIKAVGIGILGQITALICSDAGNAAMGKTLQFLSTALILWLSLPLFSELLELADELLGKI